MGIDANLGRASVVIRATLDKLDGDLGEARGKVDGAIAKMVSGAGKSFQALGSVAMVGIGTAATAVAGLGAALAKITVDTAPLEGAQAAFEGLATSAGVGADDMLAALQRGSNGMISQRDLMLSFNKAAQLVSVDFAQQLPDAMQYLGKVSAATGQDMSFLMDSLVVGVGRLSPMILDNLAIQVSQAEATARAAAMFGVEADALTKTQQQAGMMNVVLEKLAANTASMPDITETAAAKMAQFKATMQNTKDMIGMTFLPVLNTVMTVLGNLANQILPPLAAFLEGTVSPAIEKITSAFEQFTWMLDVGVAPIDALRIALSTLFPPEVVETIMGVVSAIGQFFTTVQEALAPIVEWIGKNVELQDVLIALGAAILSVVIPAIAPIVASVASIVAVFVLAVAAVAALRAAWESDFMGIRTAMETAWAAIQPALQTLVTWLQVNIPVAVQAVADFWTNTLMPAFQAFGDWVSTTLVPLLKSIGSSLLDIGGTVVTAVVGAWENLQLAAQTVADFWTNTLMPAFQAFGDWVSANLVPLLQSIGNFLLAIGEVAVTTVAAVWENVLLPAFQAFGDWASANLLPLLELIGGFLVGIGETAIVGVAKAWEKVLLPALQTAGNWISATLGPILVGFVGWLVSVKSAVDDITKAIQTVTSWFDTMAEKIRNVKLPDWMTPGSPTPLELGLLGIGEALAKLSSSTLPDFAANLDMMAGPTPTPALAMADINGGAGMQQVNFYIDGAQDPNATANAVMRRLQEIGVVSGTLTR